MIPVIYKSIVSEELSFPREFLIDLLKLTNLEPWRFFDVESELIKFSALIKKRYPDSTLVPFAYIHDLSGFVNDSWPVLALFDLTEEYKVRIYDLACPHNTPWINKSYVNYSEWFLMAMNESIQYKKEQSEL